MDKNAAKCMPVKCSVTNCTYNDSHLCHADTLEVNSLTGNKAGTSDDTCCTTFKDK
ncbi:MAG: DUF1540 domain-containing protein [Bacillota bacterium]|nr:DUF1540 domain-containing protein [Bacillota bacterium]